MTDPRQMRPFDPRHSGNGRGSNFPGGGQPGGRLAIVQLVKASLQSLWLCRDDALRLGVVPMVIYFIGAFYGQPATEAFITAVQSTSPGSAQIPPSVLSTLMLSGLVVFASQSLTAINWLRFLLLGPQAATGIGLTFGRHHLLFLLGAIALAFGALITLSVAAIPLNLLLGQATLFGLFLVGLAMAVLVTRLALMLVAVAITQPVSLKQVWEASRGQGLVMFLAVLLAQIPFLIVVFVIGLVAGGTGLDTIAPFSFLLISSILEVAATMAQCGVLAGAYRRLIGIRA